MDLLFKVRQKKLSVELLGLVTLRKGVVPVRYQMWGVHFRCAASLSWVPRHEAAAEGTC